jgi:RNA recognition motif-containing protein
MGIKPIINILLILLLGILAFQNQQAITLHFFSDFKLPLAVFMVIILIPGIIIGKLSSAGSGLSNKPSQPNDASGNSHINLFVGNLARNVRKNDLQATFSKFGTVKSVKIIRDRHSGNPKGFGFVEMVDATSANKAIKNLNGYELNGRELNVNEARSREATPRNKDNRQRRSG